MRKTITILTCALALVATLMQSSLAQAQATKPASVVSLNDLKTQLTLLQQQVGATANSLQQLRDSAKSEAALSKAAADFQNRFRTLETQMETVRTQAVVVKARVKQHYDAWQSALIGMQNPGLREKAQDRFTESKEQFDKIIATAERAKEEALPFVSDAKDISVYLDTDLSQDAVKSLSNTIWKLGNRSKSVIRSIDDVTEQIDRTINSLPKK
jgi:hypothetical protein